MSKTIQEQLQVEKEKYDKLIAKREKLNNNIRECEDSIEKLQSKLNEENYIKTNSIINATGLTLDEVLNAIRNKDLLSLQEKIENQEKATENTNQNQN